MEKALKQQAAERGGSGNLRDAERAARGLDDEEIEARASLRAMSPSDVEEAAKARAEALKQSVKSRPREKETTPWPKFIIDMTDDQLIAYIGQMRRWRKENLSWRRRFTEELIDFSEMMGNGPKYAIWNGRSHRDQTEDVAAKLAELWESDPYQAAERQRFAPISVRRELARIQRSTGFKA